MNDRRLIVIKARGSSMHPFVPDGTLMVFARNAHPKVGDIALVERNGALIAHRLVRPLGQTWGDGCWEPDEPFLPEQLAGRCVMMVRKGVVIDMDWPEIRLAGFLLAKFLPLLKGILRPIRSALLAG